MKYTFFDKDFFSRLFTANQSDYERYLEDQKEYIFYYLSNYELDADHLGVFKELIPQYFYDVKFTKFHSRILNDKDYFEEFITYLKATNKIDYFEERIGRPLTREEFRSFVRPTATEEEYVNYRKTRSPLNKKVEKLTREQFYELFPGHERDYYQYDKIPLVTLHHAIFGKWNLSPEAQQYVNETFPKLTNTAFNLFYKTS